MPDPLTTQERQEVEQELAELRDQEDGEPVSEAARLRGLETRRRRERSIARLEGMLRG